MTVDKKKMKIRAGIRGGMEMECVEEQRRKKKGERRKKEGRMTMKKDDAGRVR